MDHLFTPWRYTYVTTAGDEPGCVLCKIAEGDPVEDERLLVLHRGHRNFVVLNAFPYTCGHLMVVPYRHVPRLSGLEPAERDELIALATRAEAILEETYRAEGLNLGMNLGRCAGAGIAEHLHLHALPRWIGDTSFMTATGETRVLPETPQQSWTRLRGRFSEVKG